MSLSKMELEVKRLMQCGKMPAEIAQQLGVSPDTVSRAMEQVYGNTEQSAGKRKHGGTRRKTTAEEIEQLRQLLKNGVKTTAIAEMMGRSVPWVHNQRRKLLLGNASQMDQATVTVGTEEVTGGVQFTEDGTPYIIATPVEDALQEQQVPDMINHPPHYQLHAHECIDEMVAIFGREAVAAYCRCNIHKYRYRATAKGGQEDLEKADWYVSKLMELEAEQC